MTVTDLADLPPSASGSDEPVGGGAEGALAADRGLRVAVDFFPLMARGGGLQNARNLWTVILAHGGGHAWQVWAGPELELARLGSAPHAELREMRVQGAGDRILAQNRTLVGAARGWNADVIFTPVGVPPFLGGLPRVFGWHDSTIAYPDSPTHNQLGFLERANEGLRGMAAWMGARRADRICVQTEAMASRLSGRWGVPRGRFHIVPNGPSEFLREEAPQSEAPPSGTPVILVVAEPKSAKNLEVVPHVARALEEAGESVRVVVTCDRPAPDTSVGRELRRAGDPALEFIGRVPHEALGDLYRAASVVLLPSWLESFSATYVEAMHFGVPLVTSDMDFARAICGDAALYADPGRPDRLAARVREVLHAPGLRAELRRRGFERVTAFPDWEERLELYLGALRAAVRERAS